MLRRNTEVVFNDDKICCKAVIEDTFGPSVYLLRCTDGTLPNRVYHQDRFYAGQCFVRPSRSEKLAEEKQGVGV